MCGAAALTSKSLESFLSKWKMQNYLKTKWSDRYNIRPSQFSPIFTSQKELKLARFGLLPSWAKDPKIANMMINARAETVNEKPSYKKPLRESRCGVIADGYYEWMDTGKEKVPYFFRLKSGEPFIFAGLCEHNEIAEEKPVDSYTIITAEAPSGLSEIHSRVPVILKPEAEGTWLDPKIEDPERLMKLLKPISPKLLEWYPVSTLVNRPANDSAELIKPLLLKTI